MKRELNILDEPPIDAVDYNGIINEHFQYIEKQCYKAVMMRLSQYSTGSDDLNIENEALELSNTVLDTLRNANYKVLREFKGKSRITTYITAIISRQAVDIIRRKKGRSREKERAAELGEVGLQIHQRMFKNNQPPVEVLLQLKKEKLFDGDLEQLLQMADRIKGKEKSPVTNGTAVKNGFSLGKESGGKKNTFIVPDTHSDPGEICIEEQRSRKMREIVPAIIAKLSGEERILLRMRFPTGEGDKPRSVQQVATVLGITQKAVYKRIDRLMQKCRKQLDMLGVKSNDLL
ncbi:MAG: sigma-70 family RNA polymerase sigma factor [bacterium]|nr:sigma-70 family RNA polymerase sigma factor [bacterium]